MLDIDAGEWTFTGETLEPRNFNQTFSIAPSGVVIYGTTEDKVKSMIQLNTTSTLGVSASMEDKANPDTASYLAKEPGYSPSASGVHPEIDSGEHQITVAKTLESTTFHNTFTNTPIVITGYQGDDPALKGGKTSAANITTTGCDVASEEPKGSTANIVNWFAVYTNGFWDE